ncbi:MAG: cold shock domain-containing protein [Candidatus Liberibacter ctenarytainae]|uniref:Cold shock domain-containing protein n=1 Tax=Candidatus Liberibacter ctenarytainae TaxID=2020335 RepID=A0A937DM97_9HYPH|nr:cold shock domain-containing protein [Candidatus Liberibacter ctenarytainae]
MSSLSKYCSNAEDVPDVVSNVTEVSGTVKWFSIIKGIGFFFPDDCNKNMGDVLFHITCLRKDGHHVVFPGARISAMVQKRERGYQACKILFIEKSMPKDHVLLLDRKNDQSEIVLGKDVRPAIVKWFDRVKKFGFLTVEGITEDVFIHVKILHRYAFSGIYPKQMVFVQLQKGEKGFVVVAIYPDTDVS